MKTLTLPFLAVGLLSAAFVGCTVTTTDDTDGGLSGAGGGAGSGGSAGASTGGTGGGTGGTAGTGGGTGGTGGGTGGTAGTGGGTGGTGAVSCAADHTDNDCANCYETNCCTAYQECIGTTNCWEEIGCIQTCIVEIFNDAGAVEDSQKAGCVAGCATASTITDQTNTLYTCINGEFGSTAPNCAVQCFGN